MNPNKEMLVDLEALKATSSAEYSTTMEKREVTAKMVNEIKHKGLYRETHKMEYTVFERLVIAPIVDWVLPKTTKVAKELDLIAMLPQGMLDHWPATHKNQVARLLWAVKPGKHTTEKGYEAYLELMAKQVDMTLERFSKKVPKLDELREFVNVVLHKDKPEYGNSTSMVVCLGYEARTSLEQLATIKKRNQQDTLLLKRVLTKDWKTLNKNSDLPKQVAKSCHDLGDLITKLSQEATQ